MSRLLAAIDLESSIALDEPGIATVGQTYGTFSAFLSTLVPLSFIIAGIILLFLLIGGGFAIVASGGNAKSVESGKNQVTGAIIGFLVIFSAYWIIQIIEAVTGVPIFNSAL